MPIIHEFTELKNPYSHVNVFLTTRLLKKFPKGPKSWSSSFSFWFRLAEGAYREALSTFGLLLAVFSFFSFSDVLFRFLLFFLGPFLLVLSFLFLFLLFSSLFSFFFLIFSPIFTLLTGQFLHLSSLWNLRKYQDYLSSILLSCIWPVSDPGAPGTGVQGGRPGRPGAGLLS